MSMAVKLNAAQGNGWLVLRDGEPNLFIKEGISMTNHTIEFKYGVIVRTTINVSSTEYRRFLRECGV
jgi:hypothetical protein